jgi:hypothetical protein
MTIRALLISDLSLVLNHLLDDKSTTLEATTAGQLYAPRLAARRTALAARPDPTARRRPLTDAIAEAAERHDGYGSAIWYYTETVLRTPDVSPADVEAAERIRATFVPRLSVLHDSHATQAARASVNRARLPEYAEDLVRFPVPGSSSTLAAWVEGFVSAGETLGKLLAARGELMAATRGGATRLRGDVLGLLTRLRTALADELADDPQRLREVDAELFGVIDELAARREQSRRRRASADEPTAAQPTAEQPTAEQPTAEQPTVDGPTADGPTAAQPTAAQPTAADVQLDRAAAVVEAPEVLPIAS